MPDRRTPPASPATRRGPKHTQPVQRHSAFQAYLAGQSRQRFRRSLFQTSLRRRRVSEFTRARANHSWAVATGTGAYPAAAASCARHRLGIGAGLLTMSAEPLNANRAQYTQINSRGGSDFNCYYYYCFCSVIFIFIASFLGLGRNPPVAPAAYKKTSTCPAVYSGAVEAAYLPCQALSTEGSLYLITLQRFSAVPARPKPIGLAYQ